MKNANKRKVAAFDLLKVAFILAALVFLLTGCGYVMRAGNFAHRKLAYVWTLGSKPEAHAQLGETEAEGRRRHLRNQRINRRQLMADLDKALLLDKPSKLSDRRIP
jgi:hypothetical protein